MDYIGNKCPVCARFFHADDDIVVCPECGTPHHRECYASLGHCVNEPLHSSGYDYTQNNSESGGSDKIICPGCGKENEPDAFFCKYCAAPLSKADEAQTNREPNAPNGAGFGAGASGQFAYPFMDPMAGVPAGADLGDGVTAGEAAKYVKQNTPYFSRVFSNIASFGRSKFNFAAALFAGGYLLYRKMYRLGALLTALQAAMMIVTLFVETAYASVFTAFTDQYSKVSSIMDMMDYLSKLNTTDLFILYLPTVLSFARFAMAVAVGASFNRMYLKHCKREIIRIKSEAAEGENPETLLQTKGGVNMPLAISLLVTNLLINYLPSILQGIL